jgi:hypothetical protein
LMQIRYAKILRPEVVLCLPYPVSFILKPSIALTTFFLNVSPKAKTLYQSIFFLI